MAQRIKKKGEFSKQEYGHITPFARAVLDVVSRIPRGSVSTYASVASSAGYPRAARAVGTVLRKNYNSSVPCHRVIRSNGAVGHYNRGGNTIKKLLLIGEGVLLP